MRNDPEDLADITERFWEQKGWIMPAVDDQIALPDDPTLSEYAAWLNDQQVMRG